MKTNIFTLILNAFVVMVFFWLFPTYGKMSLGQIFGSSTLWFIKGVLFLFPVAEYLTALTNAKRIRGVLYIGVLVLFVVNILSASMLILLGAMADGSSMYMISAWCIVVLNFSLLLIQKKIDWFNSLLIIVTLIGHFFIWYVLGYHTKLQGVFALSFVLWFVFANKKSIIQNIFGIE